MLPAEDEDESADLYVAELSGSSVTTRLLSTGTEGTGNTDECSPVANSVHHHWNTSDPEEQNCSVVAIGGGGGVASGGGVVYFLSPEKLDGSSKRHPERAQPLHGEVREAPHYVTTLESVLSGPQPPKLSHAFDHEFGSFVTASGLAVDHSSGDVYVFDAETRRSANSTPPATRSISPPAPASAQ